RPIKAVKRNAPFFDVPYPDRSETKQVFSKCLTEKTDRQAPVRGRCLPGPGLSHFFNRFVHPVERFF
ncbi:MAG TPA: hypothetical protein P5573_08100, partial [Syntrophales bacterium]|nr:hypothetical protein [Syntrophales bacterium]